MVEAGNWVWPMRVLLVEDEVINRTLIGRYLSALVQEMKDAPNGLEALEVLKTYEPHLVITDLSMPKMDGISLIREMKRLNYPAQIAVLSAHNGALIQQFTQQSQDLLILYKPIKIDQLKALVEAAGEKFGLEKILPLG